MLRPSPIRLALAPTLLILLWLTGLTGTAHAQTVLPDTLRPASGRVFRLADYPGPYLVNARCTVLPGDTLLAGPGDSLFFRGDTLGLGSLFIQGTLLARGTEDSLVVFAGMSSNQITWPGIYFRPAGGDSSASVIQFAHLDGANTTLNCNKAPKYGEPYSLYLSHSLITNGSYGALFFFPAKGVVRNCVVDNQRNAGIYVSSCAVEVFNTVFLPHELYTFSKALSFYNPVEDPLDVVHHNLFYEGEGEWWTDYFVKLNTGDTNYTFLIPDSTNLLADPLFLADPPYHPDPLGSPLIDAGDPAFLDPDGTVADIGIWWVSGEETPLRILGTPSPQLWVAGYPYQSSFPIEGFPLPVWELQGAPAGMQITNLGRSRAMLSWPPGLQVSGHHIFWIKGQNTAHGTVHRDSLEVELTFQANRPPAISFVTPCPQGDCLDESYVMTDLVSAGNTVQVTVQATDDDAAILGPWQSYLMDVWVNGVAEPRLPASRFSRAVTLDTTRVVLDLRFGDGQASDSIRMEIRPRYSLLGGDVSGEIGAATGAVFVTAPLRVPPGQILSIQPGSQLVVGQLEGEEPLLTVEGELVLQGTAESPILFRSLAQQRSGVDARPPFLRVQTSGRLLRVAHTTFQGFSTALAFEHLSQAEPVRVDSCIFDRTRLGVLAVETTVEIEHNIFQFPSDSLRLGSSAIYLAGSQGSSVRNNLFLNPIVGVTAVDSDAEIANNSFLWVRTRDPRTGLQFWPGYYHLGFGRVHAFNSVLDVRNNLFQWRATHGGNNLTESQLAAYIANPVHAIWLDEESQVRADYNWYDCRNGWLNSANGFVNVSRWTAVNDSTRLISHIVAGADSADVDEVNGWRLFAQSPLIDAGDPGALWSDAFDGSRNDIGWTGGPLALVNEYTGLDGTGPRPRPEILPTAFRLSPPYPNPFNPISWLEVELDRPGMLDVRVHDLLGRQVAVLARDRLEPGTYRLRVDGSAWASGMYVVQARMGDEQQSQRLILVK
jgi:hypothetical protein